MSRIKEMLLPLISERFLTEERYRQGHIRIINALQGTEILGVHIPQIKSLAKEIVKSGDALQCINELSRSRSLCYEEKLVWGQLLNFIKLPIGERLDYFSQYVHLLSNWAECDTFCCGAWSKRLKDNEKDLFWNFLQPYWRSKREFEVRYAVIMSMCCFLDDEWIGKVFKMIDRLDFDSIVSDYPQDKVLGRSPYYVRMGVAWLLATSLYKQENLTRNYVSRSSLPEDVKKLYIRKARESFRTKNIAAVAD